MCCQCSVSVLVSTVISHVNSGALSSVTLNMMISLIFPFKLLKCAIFFYPWNVEDSRIVINLLLGSIKMQQLHQFVFNTQTWVLSFCPYCGCTFLLVLPCSSNISFYAKQLTKWFHHWAIKWRNCKCIFFPKEKQSQHQMHLFPEQMPETFFPD